MFSLSGQTGTEQSGFGTNGYFREFRKVPWLFVAGWIMLVRPNQMKELKHIHEYRSNTQTDCKVAGSLDIDDVME